MLFLITLVFIFEEGMDFHGPWQTIRIQAIWIIAMHTVPKIGWNLPHQPLQGVCHSLPQRGQAPQLEIHPSKNCSPGFLQLSIKKYQIGWMKWTSIQSIAYQPPDPQTVDALHRNPEGFPETRASSCSLPRCRCLSSLQNCLELKNTNFKMFTKVIG